MQSHSAPAPAPLAHTPAVAKTDSGVQNFSSLASNVSDGPPLSPPDAAASATGFTDVTRSHFGGNTEPRDYRTTGRGTRDEGDCGKARNISGFISAARDWLGRKALLFKIIVIGFLALLLLIPLGLVRDTLRERQGRYNEAVASITEPWGGSQRIIGPVLVVPFTYNVETEEWVYIGGNRTKEKKVHTFTREAFFLPDQLNVQGVLEPSARKRSIHTAHVYSATLQITGRFDKPDLAFTGIANAQPQWERARVCFVVSDLRGVRETLALVWAGQPVSMRPGANLASAQDPGLHAILPAHAAQDAAEFSLTLTLNGSDTFMLAPLARGTKMSLKSPWPDPSFCGDHLPVQRTITPGGFDAQWEMSFYSRALPQQWDGEKTKITVNDLGKGAFGVRMAPAVSAYRIVERAVKHGVLFIALAFTMFFLFEAIAKIRLGSLNYLLVGATLCVFFLGLLALSEFIAFGAAYAVSAALATGMIGLYCAKILRGARRALAVSAMLGGVYAYLYFVLRMEDFALLAGTAAIFAVLGALMYATRNLRDAGAPAQTPPPAS